MDIKGSPGTVIAIPIDLVNVSVGYLRVVGYAGKPLTTFRLEEQRSGRL